MKVTILWLTSYLLITTAATARADMPYQDPDTGKSFSIPAPASVSMQEARFKPTGDKQNSTWDAWYLGLVYAMGSRFDQLFAPYYAKHGWWVVSVPVTVTVTQEHIVTVKVGSTPPTSPYEQQYYRDIQQFAKQAWESLNGTQIVSFPEGSKCTVVTFHDKVCLPDPTTADYQQLASQSSNPEWIVQKDTL